jgi:hypothetical protein
MFPLKMVIFHSYVSLPEGKIWQAFTLTSAFCFMAKEEKSFDGSVEVTNQLSPLFESFYVEQSTNVEISVTSNVPWLVYHNFSSDKRTSCILVTIISSSNLGSQCSSNLPHPRGLRTICILQEACAQTTTPCCDVRWREPAAGIFLTKTKTRATVDVLPYGNRATANTI